MRGSEWSLIIFTLLIQLTVGSFILFMLLYNYLTSKLAVELAKEIGTKMIVIILPVLIIALLTSIFHLGSVKNIFYVLSNFSKSWLSREVFFVGIFSFLSAVFIYLFYKNLLSNLSINIFGGVIVLLGIISVFSMSKIYMLDTIPVWDSITTPVQFFASAFVLGFLTLTISFVLITGKIDSEYFEGFDVSVITRYVLIVVLIFISVQFILWIVNLISIYNLESMDNYGFELFESHSAYIYLMLVSFLISISLLVYLAFDLQHQNINIGLLVLCYSAVLLSEVLGRFIFYSSYSRIGI